MTDQPTPGAPAEATSAARIVQRRDNWSRETVRSQRRKLRNLKAEIGIRDTWLRFWKQNAKQAHYDLRQHWRKDNQERLEHYRTTQAFQVAINERDVLRADLAASQERVAVLEEAICAVTGDHDHGVEQEIPCHTILERAMLAAPDRADSEVGGE